MKNIYLKEWPAEFRAEFYLRRNGLEVTRASISRRMAEELATWNSRDKTLKKESDHMAAREEACGFPVDEILESFDNGTHVSLISFKAPLEC